MSSDSGGTPAAVPSNAAAAPPVTSSHPTGDRSRGRRNNRRGNPRFNTNTNAKKTSTRFESREPTLRGHIYDNAGERTPDMFIQMTKEIVNYVGRTYTQYTSEFMQAVRDLELTDPPALANPDSRDQVAFELWKLEVTEYRTKVKEYANFRTGLYNVVLGQCSDSLQDLLKSHNDFANAYQSGLALLNIIKTITYSYEERCKPIDALMEIKEQFTGSDKEGV